MRVDFLCRGVAADATPGVGWGMKIRSPALSPLAPSELTCTINIY